MQRCVALYGQKSKHEASGRADTRADSRASWCVRFRRQFVTQGRGASGSRVLDAHRPGRAEKKDCPGEHHVPSLNPPVYPERRAATKALGAFVRTRVGLHRRHRRHTETLTTSTRLGERDRIVTLPESSKLLTFGKRVRPCVRIYI